MIRIKFHIILLLVIILGSWQETKASSVHMSVMVFQDISPADTTKADSLKNLPYTPSKRPTFVPRDRFGDPFTNRLSNSPLYLQDPASLKLDLEIDTGMNYTIYEKIGDINYRPMSTMSFSEFKNYQDKQSLKSYWKDKSSGLDGESAVSGRRLLPKLFVSPVLDRIFGGSYVDIQPNGFLNLDFGGRWQKVENPAIPIRQQRTGGFNYNQQISMNVTGKIGDKLSITANFDNNNSFDFQNNLKVEYTGYEEDIIKKIEIGNVSMPVSNSLMTGGQSLFGLKTQLQFGKLFVTAVASRQQGRNEVLDIPSGFQGREFEVRASDYDENRHFFLGHFFRDNYERWLGSLPQIISGVNVTRVEVYILNRNNETQTLRNIVGLMDLGEGSKAFNSSVTVDQSLNSRTGGATQNGINNLFDDLKDVPDIRNIETAADYLSNNFSMTKSVDFETITAARKLDPREYKWNSQLGYISLLRKLQNDEVLAVSYEYTFNGQRYKVGELAEDYQGRPDDDLIMLKLLRPTQIDTRIPTWDLMMKNVYYLNAYRLSEEGFTLRINYRDDLTNIDNPSLNVGAQTKDIPLVRLLGLDELNRNGDRQRDGNFDFIEGVTVDKQNGNIIFPVLEPFGRTLESHFRADEQNLVNTYVYDTLYRTTQINAQQVASKNKYFILGSFQSGSASEIRLEGINIEEESVQVTAGGTLLTPGLDYTVDGRLGVVRIINDGVLNSGKNIQISYEKADLFNFQTRWLTGADFEYRFSDNFNLNATVLHLNERPGGISRFSVGDEPTRNTKYGFAMNYQKESRFLTKMIDALPILNTKEKSNFSFNGEFAQIIPGTSNIVDGEGTSYIDDFENAATPINIAGGHIPWKLASTPETTNDQFVVDNGVDNLGYGYRRAKLAWYIIDNTFYRSGGGNRPDNISEDDLANSYVKPVLPQEIFKQRDRQIVNTNEPIFDLAYYPSERGPYNYNPNLTADGLLSNPEQNFGGITRANTSEVNWNKNNIEYLEFWMMDPFVLGPNGVVLDGSDQPMNNTTGGDLVFNFGSISEDLMKDNRHAFENGLPADGSIENTTNTEWGKVTTLQYLTDFFDNSSAARTNQDVGFDGLKSSEENTFPSFQNFVNQVGLNQNGRDRVLSDVSADDFQYFLDEEFDARNAKILERYKNFNGTENNSPIDAGAGNFTASSSNIPENEDLNNDNTISDVEEYFEFKIPLQPGELEVGERHIIDQVQDDQGVSWYQFRIPIRNPDKIFGSPTYESIKFYRTYLTGWRQPVVLRFAKFQLVGSQWRKFEANLEQPGFGEVPESTTSDFDVSVVNVEDNSVGQDGKSPYVIPPGLNRDLDNTTTIQRRNNEQSLRICVEGLEDGDARAVFKNVSLDLLNYGRLKMFLHAETNNDNFLQDDEVTAFLRFGRDFVENYYEIEVPLKITPSELTASGDELRRLVWPLENEIDISIDELYALKLRRDRQGFDQEQAFSGTSENGNYNLTVEGNPKMNGVQTLMIGVRNPKSDDLQDKSICIWANELRVADFDTQAGWAANARMSAQLADFARVNASTRYTSVGFGSIQQRISERTRDETFQYDVSADINVDKLIPGKHGIKIPMFVSMEKTTVTPKFDPLDQDLPLEAALLSFQSDEARQDYKSKVQDRTTRKAINFSNVRKEKVNPESKSHIYDIENFSFNYAYSESVMSNINTEAFIEKNYRGGFAYNFSPSVAPIEPFKNVGFLSGKYLQLIKDINFSFLPNSLSMRAEVDRRFTKRQLRNSDLTTDGIDPYFEKYFNFNRSYGLRWNLTKSLSIDYSASARAIVDEPEGDLDTQAKKDSVRTNLKNLGRMKNFDQSIGANYRLPLDKIPLTDWLSADLRYAVRYNWNGGSIDQIDDFGNIISNNRDRSANGKVDMVKLYNKIGFLKDINTPKRRSSSRRSQPTTKVDTTKQSGGGLIKGILRMAMSLRSINLTYSVRESTVLPGFKPRAYLFGLDSGLAAPGRGFIFGSQDPEIRFRAADNGWLVRNPFFTSAFTQSLSEDLNLKANIEPFKDLKIQLDMKRTNSGNFQEIFRYDSLTNEYNSLTPTRSGSYSVSFFSLNTAFVKDDADNISPTFTEFENYREIIRNRLNSLTSAGEYPINSQDVLVPAFIAAYSGRDPNTVSLTPFPKTPLPNWRVDYAGLSKLEMFKDLVSSINLTHSYSSTFRINNYTNSLDYSNALDLTNSIIDYPLASESNDVGLVPVYILNEVSIAERFSPLIGINVRTKSRNSIKVEWKKERNLSLNLSNSQVTELRSSDISFDFGMTKKDWKLPFKVQGRTTTIKNDIQFRVTFTVRDTKTIQRKIDDVTTITAGNINYQFRPTVSYVANEKLNLTMYFERNINQPRVSNSFNRATTAFGIQMRFSLAQ